MLKKTVRRIVHPAILVSLVLGIAAGVSMTRVRADEGWSCPVPEFTTGECTCRASGCRATGPEGGYVCNYTASGGSGCSCPPLEMCSQGEIE